MRAFKTSNTWKSTSKLTVQSSFYVQIMNRKFINSLLSMIYNSRLQTFSIIPKSAINSIFIEHISTYPSWKWFCGLFWKVPVCSLFLTSQSWGHILQEVVCQFLQSSFGSTVSSLLWKFHRSPWNSRQVTLITFKS